MAMTNYPYPSNFLEPLPGWPVEVGCNNIKYAKPYSPTSYDLVRKLFSDKVNLLSDEDIYYLQLVKSVVDVYYNYTGNYPCYDLEDTDGTGQLDGDGWNYLACTGMCMPQGSNGETDMFPPSPWLPRVYSDQCFQTYGVRPNFEFVLNYYGGLEPKKDFSAFSNIVFSNGQLDPWRFGGVNEDINDSVISLYIELGAHHLDLRAPNPQDPDSVVQARIVETQHIKRWIEEYQNSN